MILEEEADAIIGAGRHERTVDREAYRVGHYDRKLTTTSGEVIIRMPKLTGMRFAAAIIECYRERDGRDAPGRRFLRKDRGRLRDPLGFERLGVHGVQPQREGIRRNGGMEEQSA